MNVGLNISNIPINIGGEVLIQSPVKEEQIDTPKKTKTTRKRKEKEIPVSPFLTNEMMSYFGNRPKLIKYKEWLLVCNLVKSSSLFKDIYKNEVFAWGALEETAHIYPVWTKEPTEIKNHDGVVIETIPGVYDQEKTMVLPPKFIFAIYRQFLFSQECLSPYLEQVKPIDFPKYQYNMISDPRDEQKLLADLADKGLKEQKYFKGIVQCPPGWGKTFISIYISSLVNGRAVIVVPNTLLAKQWKESIVKFTNLEEDDISLLSGSDLAAMRRKGLDTKPISIILIQSLDSQLKRCDPEDLFDFYRNVSVVFYDETHTSGAADGYGKTSAVFHTFNIIGLSATPYKKDKNLFLLYTGIGQIVYISTHQNLIPTCNMHLVPINVAKKDLDNLFHIYQSNNYNLFLNLLEDILFKDHYYFVYLTEWLLLRYNQGYSTVVLFKTNRMLEKLDNYVSQKCDKLQQEDPNFKRPLGTILTSASAKAESHKLHHSNIIYSNYKMFSAGADYPHISCVFFASMILGKTGIIQSLGRTTRKFAEKNQNVQAHFFLPKCIYPLYKEPEPHQLIVRSVKLQYPTAVFKWDKVFTEFFQERKEASDALKAQEYKLYQQRQMPAHMQNTVIESGRGITNGTSQVHGTYDNTNRLSMYQQAQQTQQTQPSQYNQQPTIVQHKEQEADIYAVIPKPSQGFFN